ncbi:lysM domain receptor-like kinase 4, partial [Jatropha curcas]|uniref:lysM domain receptor-like kinase 4 n=1 Tax=Jatropha curcas TaxID=180498 RepID=UPI0005FA97DC
FFLFLILVSLNSIQAQQYYDSSDCSVDTSYPGSRYTCNFNQKPCSAFLVYRANQNFNTVSSISRLLQVDVDELLHLNNLSSPSEVLEPGSEVLFPVFCFCLDQFFQANLTYTVPETTTLSDIACLVFEGLVKSHTLVEENASKENEVKVSSKLNVPLRCACPTNFSNEIMFLVTYPLMEGDTLNILSKKFSISTADILAANYFEQPWPTIYPQTTILIPLKRKPKINFSIPNSPTPTSSFLPTITVEKKTSSANLIVLYSLVSVVGAFLLVIAYGWYARKRKINKLQSFNTRSSPRSCSTGQTGRSSATFSCLSPDLLVGIKYSLKNYSIEDLKRATKDFSKESKTGDQTYKGWIDNVDMMIEQMKFEDTRQVINIHSKINHINIVNMVGVCYGDNNDSWSYLIFELPLNGCLRDCLSNLSGSLEWYRRIQIAVDIARGLHYLHHCIFPSYAHKGVNSRNIFITANWRAKLTNIRSNNSYGLDSDKLDIFAFGVVLLELISGREDVNGKLYKDWIGFLGGGGASEGGCFDQLKSFIDPCLKDYPLADALCLAVLAKACVEDNPLHRPSMDDILKVLVRLV